MSYGFQKTGIYTRDELMIVAAAREIQAKEVIIVGQGLPILAGGLAKSLYHPDLVLCTEAGLIDFEPFVSPQHIADPCCTKGFSASADLIDMFTRYTGRGFIDVCFLGCAQIDRYGNVNTTATGPYFDPENLEIRFPGAGGNPDFLAYSKKTIITMRGGAFVNKLDYFTSPGYLTGGNSRYENGMPEGTGPHMVITTNAVFRFDPITKEIYLAELFPGVTVEEIKALVPWELKVAPDIKVTKPPTEKEVGWIRQFDPISAAGRSNALGVIARALGEKKKKLDARRGVQKEGTEKKKEIPAKDPSKPTITSQPKPSGSENPKT